MKKVERSGLLDGFCASAEQSRSPLEKSRLGAALHLESNLGEIACGALGARKRTQKNVLLAGTISPRGPAMACWEKLNEMLA